MHSPTIAIAVCLLLCLASSFAHPCGSVFDGLHYGQRDLQEQSSLESIAAHWFNFKDVLVYEYAVISTEQYSLLEEIEGSSCFSFAGTPDVVQWTNAQKSNSATISKLRLALGNTYHVLVRATFHDGSQGIVSSDGVDVVPYEEKKPANSKNLHVRRVQSTTQSECSIDAENRCTASKVSVGDFLTESYGPPVFNFQSPTRNLMRIGSAADRARAGIYPDNAFTQQLPRDFEGVGLLVSSDEFPEERGVFDDDDDEGGSGLAPLHAPVWVLAPVIIFLLLVAIILLVVIVLARVVLGRGSSGGGGGGGGGQSYGATLTADGNETKDYSQRAGAAVGDTDDRTTVAFPDMNIRRLSISHENAEPVDALEEATKSPRRKHPIMQSASSSFRNYNDS